MIENVFNMKLLIAILIILTIFVLHEWGHYLAYKIFGIPAHFRRSILAPGIDPNETVVVSKLQGMVIALAGFFVSTCLFTLPMIIIFPIWKGFFLIITLVGSCVDFLWAISMIFSSKITISSK